jgi:hypothetical protein
MTIKIITDSDNKVAVFKSHDAAAEYIINHKNAIKIKNAKGSVKISSKKEYIK